MTATIRPKIKRRSRTTKPKSSKSKAPPSLYEQLAEGIDEMRRHFAGEKTGVTVTVHVSPKYAAGCVADLKAARVASGLTLAQVSARTGLRVETLSRLELGKVPNPTIDTLAKYAAGVGRVLTLGSVPMKRPPV